METTHSRKRMAAAITAVIVALLLIAGTFMWWSANDSVKNEMALDRFDVKITETFDPNTPIFPGAEVEKRVGVTNNSNIPAVVRVQLEESVELPDLDSSNNVDIKYESSKAVSAGNIIVKVSDGQIATLTAASGWSSVAYSDTDVKIFKRQIPAANGSGTTTEYFAYVDSTKRLASYDSTTGTVTYAYFTRTQVATGIHDKTSGDLPATYHNYITISRDNPLLTAGVNTAGWVLDASTGWHYYNQALYGSSATVVNLIDKVSFATNLPDTWQGAKYTLTPVMEAAQFDATAIPATWSDVMSGMVFYDGADTITIP